MVNIAMVMATGAEQSAIPHLPATSTAGVAPVSFHESFEKGVAAGLGKSAAPVGMPEEKAGTRISMLRTALVRVEGDESASGAKVSAEVVEPACKAQLRVAADQETSSQVGPVADSKNEDSTHPPSVVATEDLSSNTKGKPVQGLVGESSSIAMGRELHSEKTASGAVHEPGMETEAKVKRGSKKEKASSDAPEVVANVAGKNLLQERSAATLPTRPAEPVAPVVLSDVAVPLMKSSKDEAAVSNVSAKHRGAVGVNKRAESVKAPASAKEKLAVAGAEERSVMVADVDDGSRVERFHANDSSRSSSHGMSAAQSDGTGKPHGAASGEVQVMPLSPSMKEQAHTLMSSSAGKDVSVSGGSHEGPRGETGAIDAPTASASEHRALAASPTMLEVGVPGGSHGWLKIRAELAGDGAVHASVSSSSTAGAEMLRRELPSLATYLHQEQVTVGSLVVHASAGAQDSSSMSSGSGESSAGRQEHADAQHDRGQQEAGSFREWNERSWADGVEENGIAAWLPQAMYSGNGGWLSVRA